MNPVALGRVLALLALFVALPALAEGTAAKHATVWFVQIYYVKEGQLEPMKKWLTEEGGRQFLDFPGADAVRPPAVTASPDSPLAGVRPG